MDQGRGFVLGKPGQSSQTTDDLASMDEVKVFRMEGSEQDEVEQSEQLEEEKHELNCRNDEVSGGQ